jgi:hypothetical protein
VRHCVRTVSAHSSLPSPESGSQALLILCTWRQAQASLCQLRWSWGTGDVTQTAERPLCKLKVLSLNPSSTMKKKEKNDGVGSWT